MTNEEIEKKLDEIDIFMINSLDDNYSFKNMESVNEIAKRITQLQGYINDRSRFYERFTVLTNAFIFAQNRISLIEKEALDAQKYFNWVIQEKKNAEKEQKNEEINKEEALGLYSSQIETGHLVNEKVKTILEEQYRKEKDSSNNNSSNLPKKLSIFDKIKSKIKSIATKLFKFKDYRLPDSFYEDENNIENIYENYNVQPKANEKEKEGFKNRYKVETKKIVQTQKVKSVPKEEIMVVSDIHGNIGKWDYVKQALEKNPGLKLVIEGDAMDRGPHGLEILMQIRELTAEGRAMYLPGNHDVFAYDYLKTQGTEFENSRNSQIAKKTWELNGGKVTLEKFNNFDYILNNQIEIGNIKQRITKQELIDWLGNCQIQIKMQTKGMKYALSHAMFDDELYNADPYFNLEKALALKLQNREDNIWLNKFKNCMWYREEDRNTHYADISWPEGYVTVVGHTRQESINMQTINNDPNKPIIYLDCGKGKLQGYNITENRHVDLEPKSFMER